jgi:hypothetical protein
MSQESRSRPGELYPPFGEESNDGVLMVHETDLSGVPEQTVPVLHPFIIHSKAIAQDITKTAKEIRINHAYPAC